MKSDLKIDLVIFLLHFLAFVSVWSYLLEQIITAEV